LLPEQTKEDVKAVWGEEGMWVRTDLVDIAFGYRAPSLADSFAKEAQERNVLERIFVDLMEHLFGKKAALYIQRGGDGWDEVVSMIKDIWVIKSVSTLWGNVKSNVTLLTLYGVPAMDLIRNHRTAFVGVADYRKSQKTLIALRVQLAEAISAPEQRKLKALIAKEEDALKRNPVSELLDAGMMPSIVEDVAADEDPYSYQSLLENKTEKYVDKVNPKLVTAAKWVLMTKDTPIYQGLSYLTQVSDFVGRYTLYEHLTKRKENPVPKDQALQIVADAFVNYDIPSHRLVHYANTKGLVWFTKYYMRIQKVIFRLFQEHPARAISMVLLDNYFSSVGSVTDSAFVHHIGSPFSIGALKLPEAMDDLATIKAMGMLIK
jgi:hypothetical protein